MKRRNLFFISFLSIFIIVGILFIFTASEIKAKAVEINGMRMQIDNNNPLLISALYGDPDDKLWYGNTLTGAWDLIPDDVKPYSVLELHPGKICKPTSCIPKDTPELRAWYTMMLDEAQENDIPVMLVIMSAGEINTVPVDWLEEQFQKYSVLKGVLNIENYWIYNDRLATNSAKYIEACAKYGAYFIWHDHKKACWERIMSNEALYSACKKYKDNVILTFKNTPISDDAGTDSIINGFWLSDLCGNWGGSMDTWKWWEKSYTTVFSGRGNRDMRSYCSEPEAMLGMEMMNIYANGGTVYNFECPAYTFAANDVSTPAFNKAIIPFFRYAMNNPTVTKQEVIDNTKIMFWAKDGGMSQMGDFYRDLSSDDETMPLYDTGRYGIIPVIPAQLTEEDVINKFPNVDIITKKSPELSRKVEYFNSKYPQMYDGTAFAQIVGNRWFIYNSNANVNERQYANLPLYTNSCKSMNLDITPHTYAIVEENTESIHIILNNYRVDKTELWARSGDWSSSWGQGEVNISNWVSESYAVNPQDMDMRTTEIKLFGHNSDDMPQINISGDDGHYNYEEQWDKQEHIYTITINHNGNVDILINASGDGPSDYPQPDDFEQENIALYKETSQSSILYGAESSRAVDGNINGDYGQWSVTHTKLEEHPWWTVDLGEIYDISEVIVYNRTDNCSDRLSDYEVSILDSNQSQVWSNYQENMPDKGLIKLRTGGIAGRYVKIQLRGSNYLSLAEVVVHGYRKNLALEGSATQSSTEYGGNAYKAIDGDTSGDFSRGSVTHTSNENQAWWMVDLGDEFNLSEINVFNRTDACTDRLRDYSVIILDANNNEVFRDIRQNEPNPMEQFLLDIKGKYVKIQLNGANYLSLAEVQVFGK